MTPANDNGPLVKDLWHGEVTTGSYISLNGNLVKRSLIVDGYVYVIGFERWAKIGFTRNVRSRISGIQSGLPIDVVPLGIFNACERDEKAMLYWFSHLKTRGEWFNLDGSLADWVRGGCKQEIFDFATSYDGHVSMTDRRSRAIFGAAT